MENQFINRVEAELGLWRAREERFSKLFPFNLSGNKAFLKEKLKHYNRIATRYKGTQNLDERFALRLILQERRQMEKKLYPNLLLRMLRRLLIAPVSVQITITLDKKKNELNSETLYRQVQRAGFPDLSTKIGEQIKQGYQQFSIPVSHYINDKERIDHQLSFAKDPSGQYQLQGYKTTLHNESKPDEKRQQYFSTRDGNAINTTEAYNLLSGRCVQSGNTWTQLDFNDKDAHGNFRVKQFHGDYGFDLEKALRDLPLKELLNRADKDKLQDQLKNGNRVEVSFVKEGKEQKFYIEANPQFKSVNIYDEHSRKVTLHTALGNKTAEATKAAQRVNNHEQLHQGRKNGVKIGR